MSEVHVEAEWIEVRYTPAMVNGAVSTFVLRRLRERRGIWLAAIGLLLLSTWLARQGPARSRSATPGWRCCRACWPS